MTSRLLSTALVLIALAAPANAQQHVTIPTIEPRPDDVRTLDGIVAAFYATITGPAGHPRQWGRDRTLYWPGVRFFAMGQKDGEPAVDVLDHQAYVDRSDAGMVKRGFFETEIHRVVERFGNLAHVFSTYETRETERGPVTTRGINSIQAMWDGKRWWIVGAIWDDERPDNPIPAKYLP